MCDLLNTVQAPGSITRRCIKLARMELVVHV